MKLLKMIYLTFLLGGCSIVFSDDSSEMNPLILIEKDQELKQKQRLEQQTEPKADAEVEARRNERSKQLKAEKKAKAAYKKQQQQIGFFKEGA